MKILIALTYYRPHTSGLTIYAERIAKAFVQRGHQVTILTSRYDPSLPKEELLEGVRVVRAPVLFRISKGVIMPTFGLIATKLVREHDVIHLHLPQFDAAGLALRGRLFKKPTIITYHCDLLMPRGAFNWLANQAVHLMDHIAGLFTHRIVTYTQDYADHSRFIARFKHKLEVIDPPVILPKAESHEISRFGREHNPQKHHPVIGMAARFATEKGVEVLLAAVLEVIERLPNVLVWFAGPYRNILGEELYYQKLQSRIESLEKKGRWKFLGLLSPQEMAAFYPNLDMLVIPSLNSTEAFGLVQIEAMMNGVPSIASDLPGVRQPVLRHRHGSIIPIGDAHALASAIVDIAARKKENSGFRDQLLQQYAPDTIAQTYEKVFAAIQKEIG